jgi:CBS-domain-containing membrane protein
MVLAYEVPTCQKTDNLLVVFEKLAVSHTHRLIVVDAEHRLQGIVSLADLFRFFLSDTAIA